MKKEREKNNSKEAWKENVTEGEKEWGQEIEKSVTEVEEIGKE